MSLCVALAAVLSLGPALPGSADTAGDKRRLDSDIAALRVALEGTSKDLAQAFVELQRTKAELPQARRALAAAGAARDLADRRHEAMATALKVAHANAAQAGEALAQNARDSQAVRDQLGNLARDDYQRGEVSGLSIALGATSPGDFANRMLMMDTVTRVRAGMLRRLDTAAAQGRADQAFLVAVRRQVATLKTQADAALAQATDARNTAAAAKTNLDHLYAAQSRDEAKVAAKRATERSNLERMQAQSDSLASALATRAAQRRAQQSRSQSAPQGGTSGAPPGGGHGFMSPPLNAPVSSGFGMRFDPVLRLRLLHAGMDFAAPCGSPVYAAAAGEVIMTTPESRSGGYGNRLVIDHGLQRGVDLTTTYNHLTRFVVTSGRVARGQLVAYSGTTGFSTGCHLHFETRQNGTPVNPRSWL